MKQENIIFSHKENIAQIIFNRPDVLNSINRQMALELQMVLEECSKNDKVRAIIIKGEGKAFSAGQDLKEAMSGEYSIEDIISVQYNPLILMISNMHKPIIAAVNGVAAGAGANLAFACDIVVAAKSAKFIQAFSQIGLIPDTGGTYFLPKLIGLPLAKALMFTGEKISAEDAQSMGMIYKAIDDENFETYVEELATKLSIMPTKALALTKKALVQSYNNTLDKQLVLELKLQVEAGNSYDYKEGVNAFLEKRKPKFTGK